MQKDKSESGKRILTIPRIMVFLGGLATIVIIYLQYLSTWEGTLSLSSDWLSIISVLISLWTLIATVNIAFYVYDREKRDIEAKEKNQQDIALAFMRFAVADGVNWLITEPEYRDIGACYSIKEYMNKYDETLSVMLSQKDFCNLIHLVEILDKATHNEDDEYINSSFLYRGWLWPIMDGYYHSYNACTFNVYDLLSEEIYSLMQHLGVQGTEAPYITDLNVIKDNEDRSLFERSNHIHSGAIEFADSVYNIYKDNNFLDQFEITDYPEEDRLPTVQYQYIRNCINIFDCGVLVCSGEIDFETSRVSNGFERIYDDRGGCYIGFLIEGRYFGPGILYNRDHKELMEGYWSEGKFWAGKEYNYIIKDKSHVLQLNQDIQDFKELPDIELVCQYTDDLGMRVLLSYTLEHGEECDGLNDYFVADIKLFSVNGPIEYFHIRSLRDFLEIENPKLLDSIIQNIETEQEN